MQIDEVHHGAVKILKPQGPLIEGDAPALKAKLMESITSNLGRFVVDLSAAAFIDSAGLEVLVELSEELSRAGQVLRLCAANRTIREVLDLTDLAPLFDQFEDVTSAVRSFM